ncbi:hypothetical protein LINPERPRIM_LOCUS29535 [Linum perenne]
MAINGPTPLSPNKNDSSSAAATGRRYLVQEADLKRPSCTISLCRLDHAHSVQGFNDLGWFRVGYWVGYWVG